MIKKLLTFLLVAFGLASMAYAQDATPHGTIAVALKSDGITWGLANLDASGNLKVDLSGSTSSQNVVGTTTSVPLETDPALEVRPVGQTTYRSTFSLVTSGVDPTYWTLIETGTGMAVNQTGGNLVITSGTTANSETIIRSNVSFMGSLNARWQSVLSQRIAQNNFYVELVDVIGDGLTSTINSAISYTVTIPSNPFTSANVGQFVYLGNFTGTAAQIPGRYAIASVSGNNVTFTVSGFPATGAGTCSVFGWNYHHVLYTSTTATNANYDAQRNGWDTGDTTATINTTAAPGHVGNIFMDDGLSYFSDSLVASTTTPGFVVRANRLANIPATNTPLYLQIHIVNGTSAPASTTTWTMGFASVQTFAATPVAIESGKLSGAAAQPVVVAGALPVGANIIGALTANQSVNVALWAGTANPSAGVAGIVSVGGNIATGTAPTADPVPQGLVTLSTVPAAAIANGLTERMAMTGDQQVIVHQDGDPTNEWTATSGTTPLASASSTALKAAGGAGIRNYCTGIQIVNNSTTGGTVSILDGATVIWTMYLPPTGATATGAYNTDNVVFRTALKGTAATAMNIQLSSASMSVYYNVQGFQNN